MGIAAYFILLTYFSHSTPGKMLFRLEVVTKSGEWTFLNIVYRETVGRFLSSLLCIGYLAVLVQGEKQGFHDMLCDTYVVYRNMAAVPLQRYRGFLPVITVCFCLFDGRKPSSAGNGADSFGTGRGISICQNGECDSAYIFRRRAGLSGGNSENRAFL